MEKKMAIVAWLITLGALIFFIIGFLGRHTRLEALRSMAPW